MSERHDLQKPDYGRYSPHEEPPVRKVTIQQKVVQPLNTSVLTTNNSDSFRRYPTVVSHNPSGRGHRGKNWAKPSRGVVAHIVKDLDRGVARHNVDSNEFGERRKSDDTMGPGKYSLDPEQRVGKDFVYNIRYSIFLYKSNLKFVPYFARYSHKSERKNLRFSQDISTRLSRRLNYGFIFLLETESSGEKRI